MPILQGAKIGLYQHSNPWRKRESSEGSRIGEGQSLPCSAEALGRAPASLSLLVLLTWEKEYRPDILFQRSHWPTTNVGTFPVPIINPAILIAGLISLSTAPCNQRLQFNDDMFRFYESLIS
ncbi:MAG TPA: hypothetical protein VF268_04415 [Gammaproteobacteria bacterium]